MECGNTQKNKTDLAYVTTCAAYQQYALDSHGIMPYKWNEDGKNST